MSAPAWLPEPLRAAVAEHRRAVAAEAARDWTAARAGYARALSGFASAWTNPELPTLFEDRLGAMELIGLDVQGLREEFMILFPRWLIEFHIERATRAIAARRLDAARLHASALHASLALSECTEGVSLEACQSQIVVGLVNEAELRETPRTRERALLMLDRILQADPRNTHAENLARSGYAAQLASLLFPQAPASGERKRARHGRAERTLMDRSARRLRHYLRGTRGEEVANRSERCREYLILASFLASFDSRGLALRMARRGRRLDPKNEEAGKLLRGIRRRTRAKR